MTETTYKSTITEITVHDDSRNCLTDFEATVIKLTDEGGGAYITIVQGENEIRLDINELPLVNEAIDRLMMQHKDRLMMQHKIKEDPKQERSEDNHVLAVGQRWKRGDGKEVTVFLKELKGVDHGVFYRVGPVSVEHALVSEERTDSFWYKPNGKCCGLSHHPNLALVELLQP